MNKAVTCSGGVVAAGRGDTWLGLDGGGLDFGQELGLSFFGWLM